MDRSLLEPTGPADAPPRRRAGVPPQSEQMRDNIKAALASDHVEIYGFYSREWATATARTRTPRSPSHPLLSDTITSHTSSSVWTRRSRLIRESLSPFSVPTHLSL